MRNNQKEPLQDKGIVNYFYVLCYVITLIYKLDQISPKNNLANDYFKRKSEAAQNKARDKDSNLVRIFVI